MDAFRCDCQLPDSRDKFRAINPQFPSCLSLHGNDDLCGMTIAIVQSNFFSHSFPGCRGCGGKEFAETIFINLFSRGEDFHDRREVCFGFFARFTVVSNRREDEKEKPWKICGVTLESSQFIVRGWFSSFSFEQTNIKICFYIFTSMEMIFLFLRRKVREILSVSLSCMNWTFHCCPFVSGWRSLPRFSGQRMIRRGFLFSNNQVCHNFVEIMARTKNKHYWTKIIHQFLAC